MNISTVIYALSTAPGMIYVAAAVLIVSGGFALMWYTIYKKGDFRAELSHGRTVFKLEAKEKHSDRK
jgi:hypothetical protein